MKSKHFLILLFLLSSSCLTLSAQRLKTQYVIKVADSLLRENTNPEIFKHFLGYEGSYQKFKEGKFYSTRSFIHKKKLKRNVEEIWILYHFNYPKVDGLRHGAWIKLDKNLKLIEPINLNFIPEFLWKNRESNFISKQEALKIGIKNFKESGIKLNEPSLEFNKETNSFNFRVENVLTKSKNIMGKDTGEMEVLLIDPISGEIKERKKAIYGVIIR